MGLRESLWVVWMVVAVAVFAVLGFAASALSASATLRPGEFCSPSKESYYEAHGFTCRIASDGRYRLYTFTGGGGGRGTGGGGSLHLGESIRFIRCRAPPGAACGTCASCPIPHALLGRIFSGGTRGKICRSGYSSKVRNVSEATKTAVYRAYGIRHHSASTYEVDHLVPLELGGSNARANLFPEPATPKPGFHQKDRLENWAHAQVCDGARAFRQT